MSLGRDQHLEIVIRAGITLNSHFVFDKKHGNEFEENLLKWLNEGLWYWIKVERDQMLKYDFGDFEGKSVCWDDIG